MTTVNSVKKYSGLNHRFTNRSTDDQVRIEPGSGETLYLDGTAASVDYDQIIIQKKVISTSSTKLQQDNPFSIYNTGYRQGFAVAVDPLSDTIYTGTNADNTGSIPAAGGQMIYNYRNSAWSLDLHAQSDTTESCIANLECSGSIYNGTLVADYGLFDNTGDEEYYSKYIYKKDTANGWSLDQKIADIRLKNAHLNQNTMVIYNSASSPTKVSEVWVRASSSAQFALQQALDYDFDECQVQDDLLIGSIGGVLVVYTRSAGVWTQRQLEDANVYQKITLSNNVLATYSGTHVMTLLWNGTELALTNSVAVANVEKMHLFNGRLALIKTSGTVNLYTLEAYYMNLYQTFETGFITSAYPYYTSIALNDNILVVGSTSLDTDLGAVYVYNYYNEYSTINNDIVQTQGSLSITSGPIIVTSTSNGLGLHDSNLVVRGSLGAKNAYITNATVSNIVVTSSLTVEGTYAATSADFSGGMTCSHLDVRFNGRMNNTTVATLTVSNAKATNITATDLRVTGVLKSAVSYIGEFGQFSGLTNQGISNGSWTNAGSYFSGISSYRPTGSSAGFTMSGGEFTVTRAGIFLLTASVNFSSNSSGRRGIVITHGNNVTSITYGGNVINSGVSGVLTLSTSATNIGAIGKVYQCFVFQDSGGALDIVNSPVTFFTCTRLFDYE